MANVWMQMGYVPPRGHCNFKQSIMTPRCPCLRFMLHPMKSSSSFECDGCNHHASFHSMENKAEDEIRKKWEQEARENSEREQDAAQRPKKRTRAIAYRNNADDVMRDVDLEGRAEGAADKDTGSAKARGRSRQNTSARAKSRITELTEEEGIVLELD